MTTPPKPRRYGFHHGFSRAGNDRVQTKKIVVSAAFFWLTAFYFFYCARPADLFPILGILPLAKISVALATLSLLFTIGKTPRRFKDLPLEASYLLILIALLFVSSAFSPVWKGGAFSNTVEFAKVSIAWVLTFFLVTTLAMLRRIIFLQASSVAAISVVAIVKGHSVDRLNGVIGGVYSNPNDLAFAIVMSIPFCLAFFLSARSAQRKMAWALAIAVMAVALILTASRGGFISLVLAGMVLLWNFGVKGKRPQLVVAAIFLLGGLMMAGGSKLEQRFAGIFGGGNSETQDTAHESYEERRLLVSKAVDAIVHYPILGVGAGDFVIYSGIWRDVHASYLQIAVDGGIPVLILYLMFFFQGFANLKRLGQTENLDKETVLFVGALKSSLVGFVVGACFSPEAYQLFPYFTVCYTSVLWAMTKERGVVAIPARRQANVSRRGLRGPTKNMAHWSLSFCLFVKS